MSSMSASDAAPLPRLGEVFFDVRGSSRSMRLSWYADTGVSVFSIWQGGTCTGTFRLPMEELPRLIDALQRGAQAPDPRGSGAYASQLPGAPTDPRLTALPGGYGGREAEFTGPVTGDFRAIRSDDPSGTMVFSPAQAQGPLALPPGSGAQASQAPQDYAEDYTTGQYYPEQRYPEQRYPEAGAGRRHAAEGYGDPGSSYGQYADQGQQYADQGRHAEPGPYADHGYGQQGYQDRGYGDQPGYAAQGYAEPGYSYSGQDYAGQGYGDQRYAGQGYAGQGYGDPQADSDRGYSSSSYPGQHYDSGSYLG